MSTEVATQDDSQEVEAAEAFAIEKCVKTAMRKGRLALWELAEALYEFDECHGWIKLGNESLAEWLADPEVSMSMGTYRRMVRTWRKLVVEKRIDPVRLRQLDQSKVAVVVDKVAKNEVLVDEALADVESMGARDLREHYYGRRESPAEPGQNPEATEDSGRVLEDTEEPVRGDEFSEPEISDTDDDVDNLIEAEIVSESEAALILSGSAETYEFPGWVTRGAVEKLYQDFESAVDSGASFPRLSRSDVQIAVELAKAWLATHPR